ncbi:hypothetical protein M8U30_24550, partial [Enterobacter asburiae]|nr:hypothetical protein [Enterobacter asburiae]
WKPPAHSPEENMVRQKCSGIRRSYLDHAHIKFPFQISIASWIREQEKFTGSINTPLLGAFIVLEQMR